MSNKKGESGHSIIDKLFPEETKKAEGTQAKEKTFKCPACWRGKVYLHCCTYACVSRGWCPPDELVEQDCNYCNGTGEYTRKETKLAKG